MTVSLDKEQTSTIKDDFFEKHEDFSISGNEIDKMALYNQELIDRTQSATESQFSIGNDATTNSLVTNDSFIKSTVNTKKIKTFDFKKLPKLDVSQILSDSYYVDLQEFEGIVVSVSKDKKTFKARLLNKSTKENFLGTFNIDEIPSGDKELFKMGAIFIWKLGKEQNNGTQQNISQINFRRLPSFRKSSLKKIEQSAKERAYAFRRLTDKTTSSTE